ncbi:MAG: hypothetical protein NUK63_08880 [Candidatus Bathyarchaeum tardum]|nr:MAG: hypothetical protein NUK63_08880 [Candidatus Bathyarchaeum tardum]
MKLAYPVGAVTDLLATLMMVFPKFATAFWGLESFTEEYYFAMGGSTTNFCFGIVAVMGIQKAS